MAYDEIKGIPFGDDGEGVWVFVSHSHRDLDEVRRVRNALEAKGYNPLLFFLKCLDDADELDDLIKREIEARTWFLLCDSPNARESKWVQMEVQYIQELRDKYYETVDLDGDWQEQQEAIDALSKRATVFISSSRQDREVVSRIAARLQELEYRVYGDPLDYVSAGEDWEEAVVSALDEAARQGFVLVVLSRASMQSKYVERELRLAMADGGATSANLVPLLLDDVALYATGGALGLLLRTVQVVDWTKGTFDENMENLVRLLKTKEMG